MESNNTYGRKGRVVMEMNDWKENVNANRIGYYENKSNEPRAQD